LYTSKTLTTGGDKRESNSIKKRAAMAEEKVGEEGKEKNVKFPFVGKRLCLVNCQRLRKGGGSQIRRAKGRKGGGGRPRGGGLNGMGHL